jgi:sec-independent protein translocase protein TatA
MTVTSPLLGVALGGNELLIILAIVLLLFGGKRLPELARSLRRAREEFTDGEQDEAGPTSTDGGTGPA